MGVFSIAVLVVLLIFVLPDGDEVDVPDEPIAEYEPAPTEPPQEPYDLENNDEPIVNDDEQDVEDDYLLHETDDQESEFAQDDEAAVVPHRAYVHNVGYSGYIYYDYGYADIPVAFERKPLSWEDFLRLYEERENTDRRQFGYRAFVRDFADIYYYVRNVADVAEFPQEFVREPILWDDFMRQYGDDIEHVILRRLPGQIVDEEAIPIKAFVNDVGYVFYEDGDIRLDEGIEGFYPRYYNWEMFLIN